MRSGESAASGENNRDNLCVAEYSSSSNSSITENKFPSFSYSNPAIGRDLEEAKFRTHF